MNMLNVRQLFKIKNKTQAMHALTCTIFSFNNRNTFKILLFGHGAFYNYFIVNDNERC